MEKLYVATLFFIASTIFAQETLSVVNKSAADKEFSLYQGLVSEESQKKGSCVIIGSVIDQSSREPIAKAKVTILGTKFSLYTSDDGQFKIELVPEGVYQIKAEASGYESQILNNVIFGEGKKISGFFTLQKVQQNPPPDFVPVEKQPAPIQGNNPAPVYPAEAKLNRIEGTVWIKIWVDKEGNAKQATVLKSDAEIFNQASINAAMKWKFTPAILNGKPVDVWVMIPFKFKLSEKPPQK